MDGRSLPVEHPEFVPLTPMGRTIGVGLGDGTIEIVDLLLETNLNSRPTGSKHWGRGKQRPE